MTIAPIPSENIYTGNAITITIAITETEGNNSNPIPTDSRVEMSVIDLNRTIVYIPKKVMTWDVDDNKWTGTFTATETKNLLTDPNDLGSKLKPKTGEVLLEVEVGDPYHNTRHFKLTVGKSLIDLS